MGIKIPVDFSDVPERGSVRAPEGDYVLRAKTVKKATSKSSNNPMLVVTFSFESGPDDIKGKSIMDRHVLVKDSLWTLRNMLESMGYKVPAKSMKLDVDAMIIGKLVGATIIDGEEYKGRIKSEIGDYLPVSAVGNRVTGDETEGFLDDDEDDDEGFLLDDEDDLESADDLDWDDEDEDESFDEPEEEEDEDTEDEEEDEDDGSAFEDEEEDDEEDEEQDEGVELSFDADDVESASGKDLKAYVVEAQEAGFDLSLGKKPKVSDVRDALIDMLGDFDEPEDDEDFEMEDFSLDDV